MYKRQEALMEGQRDKEFAKAQSEVLQAEEKKRQGFIQKIQNLHLKNEEKY